VKTFERDRPQIRGFPLFPPSVAKDRLGYSRLENPELVAPIYAIYKEVWGPLQNFFLPCLKLKERWREGSHWRKRYHKPQTAYQRLCDSGSLFPKQRRQLRDFYATLDPFALKDDLEKRLKKVLLPVTKTRDLHSTS
jgi:hypothetical protein